MSTGPDLKSPVFQEMGNRGQANPIVDDDRRVITMKLLAATWQ